MFTRQLFHIAGVDGCKAGWLVAIASAESRNETDTYYQFNLKDVFIADTFAKVLSKTGDCILICIDIPIGLSDDKPRECDLVARKLLRGPRASSVFPAPIRPCLVSENYETASKICFERTNKKLSKQSFALLKKIREVDDLMTPAIQRRIREIHPEISFRALNNRKPVEQNKKTVPGQACRHKLLQGIFTNMNDVLSRSPTIGFVMDDAFDAFVAAWTAGQAVTGKVKTLPDNPKLDAKGLRMEILCPASPTLLNDDFAGS